GDEVFLDEVTVVIIRIVKGTHNAIQRDHGRNEGGNGKKPTGGRGNSQRTLRRVAKTADASASISNRGPFSIALTAGFSINRGLKLMLPLDSKRGMVSRCGG